MGKPSSIDAASSLNPAPGESRSTSAISLRTAAPEQPPEQRDAAGSHRNAAGSHRDAAGSHRDDPAAQMDDDDLPPLYAEHDDFGGDDDGRARFDPLLPPGAGPLVQPFRHSNDLTTAYYLDARLDSDAPFLAEHIRQLAAVPPRPFVRLRGVHRERRRGRDKDSHGSEDVVDFDMRIELTHLLYSDIGRQQAWRQVVTAGNLEKVRRGSVWPERAPGFGGSSGAAPEEGEPDVEQWCRRFCTSSAGLRCFTLERRIDGWDLELVERRLLGLVRATNYRGRAGVTFPVVHARVDVYNDCRTNRWRLTRWVRVLFYATLLVLLAWPWLLLRTRRWETVAAEWHVSRLETDPDGPRRRYASMSEEQWYAMWAPAIQRAMLERRVGELDQGDLERVREAADERAFAVEAMGLVNRSFGWGGDQW